MNYANYVASAATLLIVIFLYEKMKIKHQRIRRENDLISKYLFDEKIITSNKKPILWIHIEHDINSRKWLDFGARLTNNINEPYILLTLTSIINYCGDSFNIVMYDDNSFNKMLPEWNIDMSYVSNPIKKYCRCLGNLMLLQKYGGLLVPPSIICTRDLIKLYDNYLSSHDLFIGQKINNNISSVNCIYTPNVNFIGCKKNNSHITYMINMVEELISSNYTDEPSFNGTISRELYKLVYTNKATIIDAKILGIEDADGNKITIEDLMGNSFIKFSNNMQCIYIPEQEILKRQKYKWFATINEQEVLASNTNIGKNILISLGKSIN